MTKNDNSKHFEPSADELDTFVEEVLQAVLDGAWPLCMIDPFRVPCFGYSRDGEHFECVPWQDAADRFVAADKDRRIHWMPRGRSSGPYPDPWPPGPCRRRRLLNAAFSI